MTHRRDWHNYEVEPDRIVRRKRVPFWREFATVCAAFLAVYSIVLALFLWGW
ncbi:hypothetical protein QEZ48_19615 [Aquamicrobium lusatiense]|uniref:hypothetical protein n=1 Tax=Aquamicrobium lusatiense TaxID=89772 RepID=UPI002457C2EA|nr:hypothetical protein [Aquamicrobium lusatiense]MDH4993026.1 hypothetical protein [Aquamicrobium lusatiense]